MLQTHILLLIISVIILACSNNSTNPKNDDGDDNPPDTTNTWQLVWSDEFDYSGIPDSTKWNYDTGGHGWGNQELQYYEEKRIENSRVENGSLIIQARKESWKDGAQYTSARLVSCDKGDWLYGRFEIRAKLPSGRGTWPAIWMLPTRWIYGDGGWPDNGEIDIMEHVGYDQGNIHASIHTNLYNHKINTQKSGSIIMADVSTNFHDYIFEWYPDSMHFYVDETKYFTFNNECSGWPVWPFDNKFHLILNVAVGGTWGGAQGVDDSIFPQKMEIDYVRVYSKTNYAE